jgi:PAS domain S-box-containing protein
MRCDPGGDNVVPQSSNKRKNISSVPAGVSSGAPDKLLEAVLEAIGEGIHGLGGDGRITFVNRAAAQMLGWNVAELVGRFQHATIHHSKPDGSPFPEESCEILRVVREGRIYHRSDQVFWRKDGTSFPVDYIATPMRESSMVVGAVVAFRDISAQRNSASQAAREQELQRVLMQVPAAIAIKRGPEHRFESVNELYGRLTGNRELIGKTAREAFPEIEGQGFFELMDHVYSTGEPYIGREVRAVWDRRGDGKPVEGFLNMIYQPLLDSEDRVYGIMTHIIDVTETVEARQIAEAKREDIDRMAQDVARINRELDQFAYVASHDLRAPLRGIASLAHWIEEDVGPKLDPESRKHLELLQTRVHRMEALIEGILKYSRAGRLRDKSEAVNVAELLAESIELLSPPPDASIVVGPGMPTIETQRPALQQVFMNLIGNAIRHSRRQNPYVWIDVGEEGDFYKFVVGDDGPGIAPEFHDRIWEAFQTLESRDKVEGTGIGLALVRKHVVNRGGRAWVESASGHGANFFFLWPKRPGKDPG